MNDLDTVLESLQKDKLSDVLYKLGRFARKQNHKDLENWCTWELNGYPNENGEFKQKNEEEILKYRKIAVEWRDIYSRPIIITTKFAFLRELPIWLGVSDLEPFLEEGCSYSYPSLTEAVSRISNVQVGQPFIYSISLKRLFDKIRLEARSRFDDLIEAINSEPSNKDDDVPNFDVLIITVNDHEFESVYEYAENVLGKKPIRIQLSRIYYNLGKISGVQTALVRSEMGSTQPGAAFSTTMKAIHELNPRFIIAVGIMFGVNSEKQQIGQILYSKQIQLYELQRISTEKGMLWHITSRGDKATVNPQLLNRVNEAAYHWSKDKNELKPSSELILSGEKLIDNIDFRDQLLSLFPEAKGGEMEATGIYAGSREDEVRWIIIKAICDFADGNKSTNKDEQQKLASNKAASFVFYLLENGYLD